MNPLLHILREPAALHELGVAQWDLLLRQARRQKLTGHIAHLSRIYAVQADLPTPVRDRFIAIHRYLEHMFVQARREIRLVRELYPPDMPVLLLKGVAYLYRGLPHASGRLLSDIDLLLPEERLLQAERLLLDKGWQAQTSDAYDQYYYRTWMHELPALRHPDYELEIDLHHQILPPSGRLNPPMASLWQEADPLGEGLWTFAPIDMLLHCTAHLFQDGDLNGGLRDLVDMDQMLRHFSADPGFWDRLIPRAEELGLSHLLHHALYCCRQLLHTPLPPSLEVQAMQSGLADHLLRRLVLHVLTPGEPEQPPARLSAWLLYVRSHWQRMPPRLLSTHLLRKAWRRTRERI